MARRNQPMKWSFRDLPRFEGKKDDTEHPVTHLMEFSDFLRTLNIDPEEIEENQATDVITKFVNTLKGKARTRFEMTIPDNQRQTVAHWTEIKRQFSRQYNPAGSTREQQIKAWKDLKWDPTKESLEDFSYRFLELAETLEYTEQQQLESFLCCIPASMYLSVADADSIPQAIHKLQRCLALGVVNTNPMPAPKVTTSFPFMASRHDQMTENLRKVKESLQRDNDWLAHKIEKMAAAFDKYRDRDRERDRDRYNDDSRNRDRYRERNRDRYRDRDRDRRRHDSSRSTDRRKCDTVIELDMQLRSVGSLMTI